MGTTTEQPFRDQASTQWELVERVANSSLFLKSPRLREFLLYTAQCTLEQRPSDAREQVIADRVFGRKPDLAGQDGIVRAEARNLRKRLELYFQSEGASESEIITMPKGGYLLAFGPRASPEDAGVTSAPTFAADPITITALPALRQPSAVYKYLCFGLAGVILLLCAFGLWWKANDQQAHLEPGMAPPRLPFSALFQNNQSALIVTSDVGFLQISSILHRQLSLDDFLARSYPLDTPTQPPDLIQNWNRYEFTDGREMAIAAMILKHNAGYANRISLHSGHAVQLRDFQQNGVILIGSPVSNPWAQLYEEEVNFRTEMMHDGRILLRDAAHAESQERYPSQDDTDHHQAYSHLAFIPGTGGDGGAVLIAGTTAQATAAAGEFLLDDKAMAKALSRLGSHLTDEPRYFDVLLRTTNFVDGALATEMIAVRGAPPQRQK